MEKQSSYFFLKHTFKKQDGIKGKDTNNLELGKTIYSFISNTFPSMQRIGELEAFDRRYSGYILSCEVEFYIKSIPNIKYLYITIKGSNSAKIINCLEHIQYDLLNSGIRECYVDIISYDAISEYYCNKMFKKLNILERNLRKLLYNVYILYFGKDYYNATMQSDLQNKIKGLINTQTTKEEKKKIKQLYAVNNHQAEAIIRLQQFFCSLEISDLQKFLFEPKWTSIDDHARTEFLSDNSDLSDLSDDKLRAAFNEFTPKSDWDRFFSAKIHIDSIKELIDSIRKYRNSVAHFKNFEKEDFQCCSELVESLNKAIIQAITITEEEDFAEKNTEMIKNSLSVLVETYQRIMAPIADIQKRIEKSMQPIVDAIDKFNSSIRHSFNYSIENTDESKG